VALRPARPIWSDIARIKVVVRAEGYHDGQEGLLKSLLESCIVESWATSWATKAARRQINVVNTPIV
jgi:hypothetical protein